MISSLSFNSLEKIIKLRVEIFRQVGKINSETEAQNMLNVNRVFFRENLSHDRLHGYFEEKDGKIISIALGIRQGYPPINAGDTGQYAYIFNVYTAKEFRNKGKALNLIKKLMAYYQEIGLRKVVLDANEDSENLYRKIGFVKRHFVMEYVFGC